MPATISGLLAARHSGLLQRATCPEAGKPLQEVGNGPVGGGVGQNGAGMGDGGVGGMGGGWWISEALMCTRFLSFFLPSLVLC